MNCLLKLIKVFFIVLLLTQPSFGNQILKYADVDKIIKETNIGKEMIKKINKIDQKNIEKLSSYEKELKSRENEIKIKKNIISEQEFEKEINDLKKKISEFNKEKNLMVKNFNDIKKKELKILFDIINPIIQNYMDSNSIDILLERKNVFIGKNKSDITEIIIKEIDNKFKN